MTDQTESAINFVLNERVRIIGMIYQTQLFRAQVAEPKDGLAYQMWNSAGRFVLEGSLEADKSILDFIDETLLKLARDIKTMPRHFKGFSLNIPDFEIEKDRKDSSHPQTGGEIQDQGVG